MSICTLTESAKNQIDLLCKENNCYAISLNIRGGGCAGCSAAAGVSRCARKWAVQLHACGKQKAGLHVTHLPMHTSAHATQLTSLPMPLKPACIIYFVCGLQCPKNSGKPLRLFGWRQRRWKRAAGSWRLGQLAGQ